MSALVADAAGNFYGTTVEGGLRNAGTVYKLSPISGGRWDYNVLHVFKITDGQYPETRVTLDSAGDVYGTTYQGGAHDCGTVFELTLSSDGQWVENTLHDFTCDDGAASIGGLAIDAQGNVYGGTIGGGAYDHGVVFELTRGSNGQWTNRVLHSFSSSAGIGVSTGLIFDLAGNLYGATQFEIFVLTPDVHGGWKERTAYPFKKSGGYSPFGDMTFDQAGNLYGTNYWGGRHGRGTAFKLTPHSRGDWSSTVLHSFCGGQADGCYPLSGVLLDSAGNLYGTTQFGGLHANGVVFKLAPSANGRWSEKLLHTFTGGRDGGVPEAGLLMGTSGNLYGTVELHGEKEHGLVFEIMP